MFDDDKQTPRRSSKDTKRWCKGKVGNEHDPKCMRFTVGWCAADDWRELVCTKCGKKLDTWYPILRTEDEKKPEWVTF